MAMHDSPAKPTAAGNRGLWRRRMWMWIVAAGLDVYILGFVIGLQPSGPLCGSPLLRESHAAELIGLQKAGIGAAAVCYKNIDADSVPVWSLMALGVLMVIAGVAVRIIIIRRSARVE
ncbi:hypothetical protein [Pseudarthrobacter niigatensis]|uniref:Uncharacterized protein n=1 Tax=Pseudarthrobacter niigatensis TaxID=369935 RepID=A0AAJ1WGY3_9MICC|nr:hypothetical protein [Pseudarthrobacter niigatensis]MDQ0145978.1 hypothetical protein [Pseudarthrobacter niigatensis]MDQ0266294.1 hypothetical protein [Pseudarthrobacter niigatensis]